MIYGILICRLKFYGIETVLNIIKSCPNNRTKYVEVKGVTSKIRPLRSGLPQGSVLGPLPLIIEINDCTSFKEDGISVLIYFLCLYILKSLCKELK